MPCVPPRDSLWRVHPSLRCNVFWSGWFDQQSAEDMWASSRRSHHPPILDYSLSSGLPVTSRCLGLSRYQLVLNWRPWTYQLSSFPIARGDTREQGGENLLEQPLTTVVTLAGREKVMSCRHTSSTWKCASLTWLPDTETVSKNSQWASTSSLGTFSSQKSPAPVQRQRQLSATFWQLDNGRTGYSVFWVATVTGV